jgi:hypothetical protein
MAVVDLRFRRWIGAGTRLLSSAGLDFACVIWLRSMFMDFRLSALIDTIGDGVIMALFCGAI